VHCGILIYVLEKHENAASLSKVIKALAEKINIDGIPSEYIPELAWGTGDANIGSV